MELDILIVTERETRLATTTTRTVVPPFSAERASEDDDERCNRQTHTKITWSTGTWPLPGKSFDIQTDQ